MSCKCSDKLAILRRFVRISYRTLILWAAIVEFYIDLLIALLRGLENFIFFNNQYEQEIKTYEKLAV